MPEVIVMRWRPIGAAFSPSETSDQSPSSALLRQSARAPRWLLHCILIWLPRRLPITPLSPPLEALERLVESVKWRAHGCRAGLPSKGSERRNRVDDFLRGHDGAGVVRDIDVERGVHHLV